MNAKQQPPTWAVIIGSGFGTGFWPWGPGTAGALLATVIWFGLSLIPLGEWLQPVTIALILTFYAAGVQAANKLEPYWGKDPSRIVVDEMVGVWISLLAAPAGHLYYALTAFLLFRFFDIIKPLGVRRMEQLPGGKGVMMDDVLAGIYGLIVLCIIRCCEVFLCE